MDTYSKVIMGKDEPDCMMMFAGQARKMGLDIPVEVPDDQWIIIGKGGAWEVMS